MEQEQPEVQQQQARWRPTRRQLWTTGVFLALAFVIIVICGYLFGWKWTGLPKQTFWDWMKLLIVPAVIAAGGLWYNRQQQERQREDDQRQQALGREIESQRAHDEALQAYLDKMTDLLVVHKLGKLQDGEHILQEDPVRTVEWARTKTVLRMLDGNRKGAVLRFLTEADLITKGRPVIRRLSGADLVDAKLKGSVLRDTALQGVHLSRADLSGADLSGADLSNADLREANLTGAHVSEQQLRSAASLEGATMPDEQTLRGDKTPHGPTFEEWLKSQGRKDNGKSE